MLGEDSEAMFAYVRWDGIHQTDGESENPRKLSKSSSMSCNAASQAMACPTLPAYLREFVSTHVILAPGACGRGSEEHFKTLSHDDHDDQDQQENREVNSRSLDFVHKHCVSVT